MILNCLKRVSTVKHFTAAALAAAFICLPAFSKNPCKNFFSRFSTKSSVEKPKNTSEEIHSKESLDEDSAVLASARERTPKEVKSLSRRYLLSNITQIQPDLGAEEFKIFSKNDELRHFTYYDAGELGGEKVFLKEIKGERELKELAYYKVLKELGAPVLFQGVVQGAEGKFYIVQRFDEGGVVSMLSIEGLNIGFISESVQNQFIELKKLFFLKGIYARSIDLLISKDNKVFIINPGEYRFTGKMIRSGEFFENINNEFFKIESNIKRSWAPLSGMMNAGFDDSAGAEQNPLRSEAEDRTINGDTAGGAVLENQELHTEGGPSYDHLFNGLSENPVHQKGALEHFPPGKDAVVNRENPVHQKEALEHFPPGKDAVVNKENPVHQKEALEHFSPGKDAVVNKENPVHQKEALEHFSPGKDAVVNKENPVHQKEALEHFPPGKDAVVDKENPTEIFPSQNLMNSLFGNKAGTSYDLRGGEAPANGSQEQEPLKFAEDKKAGEENKAPAVNEGEFFQKREISSEAIKPSIEELEQMIGFSENKELESSIRKLSAEELERVIGLSKPPPISIDKKANSFQSMNVEDWEFALGLSGGKEAASPVRQAGERHSGKNSPQSGRAAQIIPFSAARR